MNELLASLRAVVGDVHLLTTAEEMEGYCHDWRGRYHGQAACVVRPGNTEEVAQVVVLCANAGIPMVPQGGNTGLCGGSVPRGGEVVISLTRLNRIRGIDVANGTLVAEAGCTLAQIQEAARHAGLFFPLSLASEGTATIGGNLSTNAGGVQVLRYGNARDLTLGLEVVLPDGSSWDGLRGLRKDNTGYDLKHLFIGAEGTLGLITAAVLKLYPMPRAFGTAWVAVKSPGQAVALLGHLRQRVGDRITAFELIGRPALELVLRHILRTRDPMTEAHPWYVLVELADTLPVDLAAMLGEVLEQAAQLGQLVDAVVASSLIQAEAFWALREHISEAQRIEGFSIKHDVAVPVSCIPEFIDKADRALNAAFPGVRIVCFGHVGDGNLHYNQSRPEASENAEFMACADAVTRCVHNLVCALGGTISAEHGLGQLKRSEILRYKPALEIEMMRAIKRTFDPAGLMNPGKVL